jgi:hypothetical protein
MTAIMNLTLHDVTNLDDNRGLRTREAMDTLGSSRRDNITFHYEASEDLDLCPPPERALTLLFS